MVIRESAGCNVSGDRGSASNGSVRVDDGADVTRTAWSTLIRQHFIWIMAKRLPGNNQNKMKKVISIYTHPQLNIRPILNLETSIARHPAVSMDATSMDTYNGTPRSW